MGGGEIEIEKESSSSSSRGAPRASLKRNNNLNWKQKLRDKCCKRIQDDRTTLLWKMRTRNHASQASFLHSALQAIVSDELTKIQADSLWEYDPADSQDILLQMQSIFYQDLHQQQQQPAAADTSWQDNEDHYLATAVYHHMQLNHHPVQQTIWCPICKQGELRENYSHVYCTACELRLLRGEEVTLELTRNRLAEAHAEHLDRGCKLTPKIRMESRFNLSVLYIECQGCDTFEVVI